MEPFVGHKKLLNDLPFMPACPVYKQINLVASQTLVQVFQNLEKSFPIASVGRNHSIPAQQGSDPSREIQPSLMLAGRGHTQPLPNASPTETQTRMKAKSRLILKNHGFLWTQAFQFFLMTFETQGPHLFEPGGKHSLLSSADTLTDASNAGRASPSALIQTAVSGVRPQSGHPNVHDSNQTQRGSSLSEKPVPSAYWKLVESVGQVGSGAEEPIGHSDLCRESIGLGSSGLTPKPCLSIPASAPRLTAIKQQSLSRSKRQEQFGRRLKGFPCSLRNLSEIELVFS
jgi:hypothetical protein